jgi:vacuolar-type H+-ATPase subunit F/Vma7
MNIVVVGDRKMVEAFELIGLAGRELKEGADIGELLHDLARRERGRFVIVQSELMQPLSEELLDYLARTFGCLVIEAPGVNQPAPDTAAFRRKIQTAVGAAM